MKKILFILTILLCSGLTLLGATEKLYAIQLKADTEETVITGMEAELLKQGVPAYIVKATVKGKLYFRLRVGPFTERSDAESFAEYHEFKDYWVTVESERGRRVVDSVVVKNFQPTFANKVYSLYFGNDSRFVVLYRHNVGVEAARLPSDMFLFPFGTNSVVHFKDITGFYEDGNVIKFGESQLVYNFTDETKSQEKIKKFSAAYSLDEKTIKRELAFFNDGDDARLTILKEYNLIEYRVISFTKLGFDYYSNKGEMKRHKGPVKSFIGTQVRTLLGNYKLIPVSIDKHGKLYKFENDGSIVFIKEQSDFRLCVIFFSKVK